jgi:hypothetical protein
VVLWNDAPTPFKTAIEGYHPSATVSRLTLNVSAKAAVHDIEDDKFWKCLYVLLRAVYPALRALRYCDSNLPVMDKISFRLGDNINA